MAMELCCVCLDRNKLCKTVTEEYENNVKLVTKLQYIAPEVEWLEDYLICEDCINQLNSACMFKEQCLSRSLRKDKDIKYEVKENVECNEHRGNETSDTDSFSDKDEKDHEEEAQGNIQEVFICYDCGETCVTKNGLLKHIKSEHGTEKCFSNNLSGSGDGHNTIYKTREFKCEKCKRKYAQLETLNRHLTRCDGIRRHVSAMPEFQCDRCRKYYTTKKILHAHKKRCDHEGGDRKTDFQCSKCNKYYISVKTLKDHCKRGCKKDNVCNVVFCKICDEYFKSVLLLQQHMQSEHDSKSYHCDMCVVKFATSDEYELHNKTNHEHKNLALKSKHSRVASRKFKCEVCNEEFRLLKTVIEHCINVHLMEVKAIRPYSCEKCENRFRSSTNLLNHMLYHDRNRTNICSFCGKSFITKNDLTSHEYTHFNHRNYKCDKCEKAFKTNTNLRTHHLIVHTDPALWKYTCQVCSKRFPQKSNHDQHLRRHIGEKNFICPLCKKPFTSKSEMQEHVSYHSNVRAYKCESCGKEYRKKYTYDVHLAKIHGLGNAKIPVREKKYACHICPSRFYDRLKLARHLCTHSGVKPYSCYVCQKKFTDKSYLKHHLKITHNIIEECKYEWTK